MQLALLALLLGPCVLVYARGMRYEIERYSDGRMDAQPSDRRVRRTVLRADRWSLNVVDRYFLPAFRLVGAALLVGGLVGMVAAAVT
jgi:hypothetical protein